MSKAREILEILFLSEMAFKKKFGKKKAAELQTKISQHLFFLVAFPNHPARRGWVKELNAWSADIKSFSRGKKKSKNFGKKFLELTFWSQPFSDEGDLDLFKIFSVDKGLATSPEEVKVSLQNLKLEVENYTNSIENLTLWKPLN